MKEKRLFDSFDVYARYHMQQADGKESKRHRKVQGKKISAVKK